MMTFLVGAALAIVLMVGSLFVFDAAEITVVERSSPASVHVQDGPSDSGPRTG